MKTRDETYKNLQYRVGADAYYQFRVVKGGSTYLTDQIVSCTIQQMLCQGGVGVEIGQACASVCNLVLLESSANWERMAKFTVSFRIVSANATTYTDWIDLGQYYTDTRSEDTYGQLTITAYDSMLLMEKTWTDSIPSEDLPASWPITARAWATLIQQNNLATFENLTQLDDTIAFVGLDTTSSIRDVLKNIAVVHGGNWMMTPDERLKLVQYKNLEFENTVSGSTVHIEDALAKPLKSLVVDIDPVQSGSGDPSPTNIRPITGWTGAKVCHAGGNIVDGLEWIEGSYYTPQGTIASSEYTKRCDEYIPVKTGDTIKFTGNSANSRMLCFAEYDSSKTWLRNGYRQSNYNNSFTVGSNTAYIRISCPIDITNLTIWIADTITISFQKSPQKNLWNEAYFGITSTPTSTVTYQPINVGDGTFTLSTDMPFNTNNNANLFLLAGNVSSGATTARNGVTNGIPRTVTSVDGYVTIGYRYYDGVTPVGYHTQLELGSTPTAYEPYAGTVYGGTLDVTTGVLTVDRALLTLDGSDDENWSIYQSGTQSWYYRLPQKAIVPPNPVPASGMISNMYVQSAIGNNNTRTGFTVTSVGDIRVRYGTEDTLENWKAFLSSNNLQIVVPLATPITYQLTPTEVTALLGENNIWTDTGDIEVTYLTETENPDQEETYIDLAQSVETLETSPDLPPVTGVHLETEAGTQMQYGSDSGYMVRAICNVATTSGIPELCLSKVNQIVYKPFQAFNVCIDPAIELGDMVKINGVTYQVMALDLLLQGLITATISAPYDQEVDHEYAIPNEDAKAYRKAMSAVEEGMSGYVPRNEFESSLVQTEQSITATVAATYVNQNVYNEQIAEIQSQLDGAIQSWSGNVVPTLDNAPAVDWTTAGQKAEHVGDTYFVNSDAGIPEAGSYYRFENNDGVYSWQLLNDTALTEALAKAAAAQAAAEAAQDSADAAQSTANTANSTAQLKGRIFVVQPTPPYDKGDLWFNSRSSDIMVCMKDGGRQSGSFDESDWEKRDRYTDDTALTNFINNVYNIALQSIRDQIDQKAETYYQDTDPAIEWGAFIAGIGVVGIDKVGVWNGTEHEGDLWFRTTDHTTWYFDGENWVQQSVPDEVFDQIDGKAQIFVVQPYPPYRVGDLWFNGTDSDIKTCTTQRLSGNFVSGDWVKYNKYTDDTKANEVAQSLTQFKTTFSVNPEDIKAEVEKRVIANKTETVNSFGWKLTDTNHIWYANNNEVMRVSQSGAYIKGEIRATTGYIGNENNGFAINDTNIRNGMTELADTSHDGIYIGTDGIALGKGKFKVTKAGVITASSGTIGGFTITASSMYTNGQSSYSGTGNGIYMGSSGFRIGSKFRVDNAGNVTCGNITATSGTFEGTVYAKNVVSGTVGGYMSGDAIQTNTLNGNRILDGTISGSANGGGKIAQNSLGSLDIASNSISGGSGGHIKNNTLTDLNVVSSGYSPSALNSTIQGQLTAAGIFSNATKENSTYPSYFGARKIQALTAFYSGGYNVYGDGGSVAYDLAGHYHQISVDANGNVQLGTPQRAKPDPFNIADTKKYKDGVAAEKVTSLDIEYTYDSEMHIYRIKGKAKNASGTIVYQSSDGQWNTDRSAYIDGKNNAEVTLSDNGVTWNNSYKLYYYGATAYIDGTQKASFTQYFNPTEAINFGKSQAAGYTNIYWGADLTRWDQSGGDVTGVNIRVYVYGTKDGYNQQITYGDKYFSRY